MARGIRKAIYRARKLVKAEIRANHSSGGLHARGLSGEGYAGGYLQALSDVLLALDGVVDGNSRYKEAWEMTPNQGTKAHADRI